MLSCCIGVSCQPKLLYSFWEEGVLSDDEFKGKWAFFFFYQGHSALNIALALVLFEDAEVLEGSYFGATVSNSSCISRLWGLKWCIWTSGKLNQYLTSEAQMELCFIRINWMLCYKRVNAYSYRLTHSSLWSTGMLHGPQFCQMGKLRLRPPLEATHSRNSD